MHLVVRKDCDQSGMVLQIPVAIVIVEIAIAHAEVDVEKPKAEIVIVVAVAIAIEETVMKGFDSDVDKVQVRLPTFLNSKQT